MLIINSSRDVKKTYIMLRTIQLMMKYSISNDEIKRLVLNFEDVLGKLYDSDDDMRRMFGYLSGLESFNSSIFNLVDNKSEYGDVYSYPISGGELFSSNWGHDNVFRFLKPMHHLFEDERFDFNRIKELVDLFEKLVDYNIVTVVLSDNGNFLKNDKNYIRFHSATLVPDNFEMKEFNPELYDFSNINIIDVDDDFKTKNPKQYKEFMDSLVESQMHADIYKVYSDADIIYTELIETKFETDRYKASFKEIPNWVISGVAKFDKNKRLSLSESGIPSGFQFISSTLYPDISKFPSKEELFSPKETESITKYKKMNNKG